MRALLVSVVCMVFCTSSWGSSRTELAANLQKSVVIISDTDPNGGAGTGFVIGDGYILTCNHVFSGESGEAEITLWDKTTISGVVVARNRSLDLAVIKANFKRLRSKPTALLVRSEWPEIGESIFWMGNPLDWDFFFSAGTISGFYTKEGAGSGSKSAMAITGTVAPGMSGSPVVNENGELVGIVKSLIAGPEYGMTTIGFATPSPLIRAFLKKNKIPMKYP